MLLQVRAPIAGDAPIPEDEDDDSLDNMNIGGNNGADNAINDNNLNEINVRIRA